MARPGPRPGGRHDRPPPRGRRAALRSDLGLLVHDGLRRRRQELVRTGTGGRGRDGSSGGVDLAPWEAVRRARRDAGAARVGGEPLLLATDELGQRRREGLPRGTCPASALGARRLDMGREGRGGRTDRDGHDGSRLGCARRASGRRGDASGHHLREHPLDRDARCEGDVDGLRAQDLLRGRDRRDGRDARFRGRRLPGQGDRGEARAGRPGSRSLEDVMGRRPALSEPSARHRQRPVRNARVAAVPAEHARARGGRGRREHRGGHAPRSMGVHGGRGGDGHGRGAPREGLAAGLPRAASSRARDGAPARRRTGRGGDQPPAGPCDRGR